MSRSPPHLVVLGGGLAGLAAAESLLAADPRPAPRVTLVEPSGRPGGVIATTRRDGWLVERSADSFLAARPEAVALVERLGLSGELIGVDARARRALVLGRGRTCPVPAGFRLLAPGRIGSILTTPLLSLRGRARLLWERFVPAREAGVTDESLESFTTRRLGREAFERLVQPLAAGIWTADPARLSMAAACPEFFAMEPRNGSLWAGEAARLRSATADARAAGARYGQFLTLASGMETLPARLAETLVARGARLVTAAATGLSPGGGGRWVVALDRTAGGDRPVLEADGVVLAVPSSRAAELMAPCDRELADELGRIAYAGSTIVSLGFRREDVRHPLDAAGLVVPSRECRRILAVSFASQKFPGRAPAGATLLRTFVGGALDPATAMLEEELLVPLVLAELRRMLGVRGDPVLVQVDRWTTAMPQYHVGHVERVAAIRRLVARHPGLAIAGAAYEGVGIPQVIASGQAAAATILGPSRAA